MKRRLPSLLALTCVWGALHICASSLLLAGTTGQSDTLRIMDYNLLNYPGSDAATRDPYFRKVVHSAKPDILIVEEMTSQSGVNTFLNDVMDYYQPGLYTTIPFHDGPDTDPHIYFKTTKVTFITANFIPTALRNIGEYILKVNATSDTIHLFAVHLKADQGLQYESSRRAEATVLRNYLTALPAGTKFMVMGDFNFYWSTDSGFVKLTESEANNNGRLKDPINQVGYWHDNASYELYHTQSPRTRSFGGGSTGGMDDRFDFILTSISSLDGNTIVSSYKAYGNDGNHLNDSINRLPNTAVPDSVANGLEYASDHLPVMCDFQFSNASLPGSFVQISPSNAASNQPINGTLTWHSASGATSYDVYLGTSNPPTTKVSAAQTDTTYAYASLSNNTTYYWKIVAKTGSGSMDATGSPWSFTTIVAAPGAFNLTGPSNSATNQAIAGSLSWQSSTNATGYDVYLDMNNPPVTVVSSNQPGTSYSYSGLSNSTAYYWKIVAKNTGGNTVATGSPWSFTTIVAAPGAFNLSSPGNSATNQPIAGSMSWQSSTNANAYDVYLGTNNPPTTLVSSNQTGISYAYSGLQHSTTYFWKVIAKNIGGNTAATGTPWSFATIVAAPGSFGIVSPLNEATDQTISGTLTWQSSANAVTYDVYLDTMNPPSVVVSANQTGTAYGYSGLLNSTTYFWKVMAKNAGGTTVSTGAPSSFVTTAFNAPGAFLLVAPSNGASGLPLSGTLSWSSSDSADSYDVFLDTLNPPVNLISPGSNATSHPFSGLAPGTAYYWKVVARNAHGSTVASNAISNFSTAYLLAPATALIPSTVTSTTLQLSWNDNANNEDGYRVLRSTISAGPFVQVGNDLPVNSVGFVDTGLSINQRYYYRVLPFNVLGNGNFVSLDVTTLANVPAVAALTSGDYSSVNVTIDPSHNPASTEFALQAAADSATLYVQADGALGAAAVWRTYGGWGDSLGTGVTGLRACTQYVFRVKARNADSVETALSTGAAQSTKCFIVTSSISKGWNLVSVPIAITKVYRSTVFPGSSSNVFAYQGRYVAGDTVSNGVGYWLKFNDDSTLTMMGSPHLSDTILLDPGWNIIGALSSPVSVSAMTEDSTGTVASAFFGYHGSYVFADSLLPMRGYWVKARSQGKLIMAVSAGLSKAAARFSVKELLPGLNSLVFEDQAGHRQTLYFGACDEDSSSLSKFDAPPLPPVEIFDVRFSSQRYDEMVPRNRKAISEFPITTQGVVYPLKVSWRVNDNAGVKYEFLGATQSKALGNSGTMTIDNGAAGLRLRAEAAGVSAVPKEFALEQNYPNPFNPLTIVNFQLPIGNYVTLKVYNVLGQEVVTLVSGMQEAGYRSVSFDGSNLPSGVYFYRMTAGNFSAMKKMILLK